MENLSGGKEAIGGCCLRLSKLAFILGVELFDYVVDGGKISESLAGRNQMGDTASKWGGGVKPSGCHVSSVTDPFLGFRKLYHNVFL